MTASSAIRQVRQVVAAYVLLAAGWMVVWHSPSLLGTPSSPWIRAVHDTEGWLFAAISTAVLMFALASLHRRRYHAVFDNLGEGFAYVRVLVDGGQPKDLMLRDVNRACCELLGIRGHPVGRKASEVTPDLRGLPADALERYARVAASGEVERFDLHLESRDTWLAVTLSRPTRGHCLAVFDDITARKQTEAKLNDAHALLEIQMAQMRVLQEQLKERALQDPVMHIHNRSYLEEILPLEVDRARRRQDVMGVLLVDVDHFKLINDTHGHAVGDAILQGVARMLTTALRAGDIVCRYGGDEILCLLPGATHEATLGRAEQLRAAIAHARIDHGRLSVRLTASIGAAVFPEHGEDIADVLRAADMALYRAKAEGRDQVQMARAGAQLSLDLSTAPAGGSSEPVGDRRRVEAESVGHE